MKWYERMLTAVGVGAYLAVLSSVLAYGGARSVFAWLLGLAGGLLFAALFLLAVGERTDGAL